MNVPEPIRAFWGEFLKEVGNDPPKYFYEAFHFDDNESDAEALAKLVLTETKRATAGLLWSFEAAKKPLPKKGMFSVVTNWHSEPLCVIETTHVSVTPFEEVSEHFAAKEGEGDKTLDYWRIVHWSYFGRECERIGKTPSSCMPVVCEEFCLVYSPAAGLFPRE